jgi:hypothetical protein
MPAVPVIAAVGAVVAAGATVKSAIEAGKARKDAKMQYKFERQLANNRAGQERINAIRAARLQQGALMQTAVNSGAGESSIALGALGSIQSQLNSNLSFLDTNQKLSNLAGYHASQANIHSSKANTWAGVSSLGMQLFSMGGGFNAFGGGNSGD